MGVEAFDGLCVTRSRKQEQDQVLVAYRIVVTNVLQVLLQTPLLYPIHRKSEQLF